MSELFKLNFRMKKDRINILKWKDSHVQKECRLNSHTHLEAELYRQKEHATVTWVYASSMQTIYRFFNNM